MGTYIFISLEYGQKSKDSFGCYKKVYDKFPETQEFIYKAYIEEYCKENMSADKVLTIIVDSFLSYVVVLLYGLL